MITLTKPMMISVVLGGDERATYDRLVFTQITCDTATGAINGMVQLTSSSHPKRKPYAGRFHVRPNEIHIEVDGLIDMTDELEPSAVQAVRGIVADTQRALEQGFISLGKVAGTFSIGK